MAVFIGLVYAAGQVKAAKNSTETAAYLEFESTVLQIGRFFVEHHNLRPYFYGKDPNDKQNPADDKTRLQLEGATEFMADFFDHALTVQKMIPEAARWSLHLWEAWILDVLDKSPCFKAFAELQDKWYLKTLKELRSSGKIESLGVSFACTTEVSGLKRVKASLWDAGPNRWWQHSDADV